MTTTFPIMLWIEVDTDGGYFDMDDDSANTDKISLIAVVGTERQVLATTTEMTGYAAKNDPRSCLRALLRDVIQVSDLR